MSDNGVNGKSHEERLPYHEPSTTPHKERPVFDLRAESTTFIGEFVGTFMFLSLAFAGTQIAVSDPGASRAGLQGPSTEPDVTKLLYIAFAFGVSLAINVAIFADISGAKFNPAVTMALFITGKIPWYRMPLAMISQIIAAMAAAGFIAALLPGPLSIVTTLHPSMSITRGLFLEAFLTSMLILTILMLEGHRGGPSKPFYIGLALFVAELCGVFYTGGSLNPARSFGPAVVVEFTGYHWIYWLGPALGSAVACGAYWLINFVKHERI
ncbi:aquaporin-like protein [Phaeosphaeria sp. MPI-PUGE-AT-0046c]|nr:aquaporin-like protein [Phaeosphaeria sp. MPI-PUGE-AT-0046c]